MKKFLFTFIFISFIFVFSGCEMLSKFLDPEKLLENLIQEENDDYPRTYTIDFSDKDDIFEIDNDGEGFEGEVYLFKYNNGKTIIDSYETGKVVNITGNINSIPTEAIISPNEIEISHEYGVVENFQRRQRQSINEIVEDYTRNAVNTSKNAIIGERNVFNIITNLNGSDYKISSRQNGTLTTPVEREHCRVYWSSILDSPYMREQNITEEEKKDYLNEAADLFEKIYDLETEYLGSNEYSTDSYKYVNTDPKVNIILMDINGDAVYKQSTLTFGFFAPIDLCNDSYKGYSNQAQILYIDSLAFMHYKNQTKTTIIHEFNHLLNSIQKEITNNKPITNNDTWYTEMLSMLSEDMFSNYLGINDYQTPKSRLSDFSKTYYQGFTYWPSGDNDEVLYFYANTFAYGSYLVRNYGGLELVKKIAQNKYVGEESIEKALKDKGYNKSFDTTVKEYYKSTLNTKTNGKTLNKAVEGRSGLRFTEINLERLKINKSGTINVMPTCYSPNVQKKLFTQGCTIHKLGKNINKISIQKPMDKNVEYEIVCY